MNNIRLITEFIFIGIIFTSALAPFVIRALYRFQLQAEHKLMSNKMNEEFIKIHGAKSGTPTMGGLMIWLGVLASVLLFFPNDELRNIFLFGWVGFGIYGFTDEVMTKLARRSEQARLFDNSFAWRMVKLTTLIGLSLSLVLLANQHLVSGEIDIYTLFSIPYSFLTAFVIALFISFGLYGIEITDGADGLVTGNLLIAYLGYLVIASTEYPHIIPYIAVGIGSLLLYLYFNIKPARVFMSSVGTFPLGFLLLFAARLTNTIDILLIIGIPFWIEVGSSFLQIVGIRFFKTKIFRLAPFHHHLEAIGWEETKVVQRFWLLGIVCMLLGLWVYALL